MPARPSAPRTPLVFAPVAAPHAQRPEGVLARARARGRRAWGLALWLLAMQVSCLPGPVRAQTCGAAGGDNRPAPVQPCDGGTASHPADGPATGTANSIDLVTGNKYLRERDASWPGGLVLDRHYNSRNPFPRTLGTGWTHGYDTVLVRIERSGPPERPFEQQPAQLTGGMGPPVAARAGRSRAQTAPVAGDAGESDTSRHDAQGDPAPRRAGGGRRRGAPAVELQILQADGRRLVFRAVREPGTPHGVVRYRAVSGDYGAVTEQPGSAAERYHWRWRDGRRIRFDADGRMRRIDPPEGRPLVLDYRPDGRLDTVRAAGGLAFRFEYADTAGHTASLRAVRLPDGQRVRYEHDALGLLVRATDALGDERRYRYEDPQQPHALTEVRDATDVVRGRFAYDPGGRAVASSLGAGAQALRVRYVLPASPGGLGESVVTDARDRESRFRWRYDAHAHRTQWLSATGDGCEACPPVGLAYDYDAQGRLTAERRADDGSVRRWRRDAQGRVIELSVTASGGAVPLARIGYAGEDPDAPPSYVERPSVAPGRWHRLAWERDAAGRVVAVRETGWTPVPASMDAALRAARFAPLARDWRITRDTDGQTLAVDGPLPGPDDRLHVERDAAGRVLRVRRPAGLETRYERDRWGRVVATVDQDGIAQRWTRGADGRPLSLEVDGAMLRVGWGADPRQVRVESPATGPLVLRFDEADRLRDVEDALGRRLRVERDAQDAVTRYDVRDATGRLLLALDPSAAQAGPPAPGAPVTRTASHGRITWREAGGHGTAARDDFGRVVATATPQGLRTVQAWDAADRLVAAVRSDGQAVRHRHDAAGRLLESGLPGRADLVRYRWLGGRLASVSDPWQTVAWQYDRHGRVIAEATLIGPREAGPDRLATVVREWHHDAKGRLTGETLPGGHRLHYRYGDDGRLRAIDLTDAQGRSQPLIDALTWLPFGMPGRGLTGWRSGNGLRTQLGHDLHGRVVSVAHAAADRSTAGALPPQFAVERDASGRTVRIDRDGRPTAFVRDAAGRLTGAASATFAEGYAWDADGNRVARVRRVGDGWAIQRQRFAADGRLVAVEHLPAQPGAGTDRAVDPHAASSYGSVRLLPDGRGRPIAMIDDQGRGLLAAYNAFGQRVAGLEAGASEGPVLYLHHAGRQQAMLDRRGELRQWRIHVGDRLVATLMFDQGRVLPWFVHGDSNGRPAALSDAAGMVHRLPERTPFGEVIERDARRPEVQRVALKSVASLTSMIETHLPGGLVDGELRDYDPKLGRWMQTDPLGVADGMNPLAFVGGDPSDRLDPFGLFQTDIHFYMTFFIARVAGLTARQALTIANATQYVDDDPATEPIPSTLQNLRALASRDGAHSSRLEDFHFTNVGFDPARRSGETDAAYAKRRIIDPANPRLEVLLMAANEGISTPGSPRTPCARATLFGVYLHALQDTFAHRDQNNNPISVGGGFGHTFYGKSPDFTFNHIGLGGLSWRYNEERALEMERETYLQLSRNFGLQAVDRDGMPITFDSIAPILKRFNAIEETSCLRDRPDCWQRKRELLDQTLSSLGLGALPYYSAEAARNGVVAALGR